jgi:site-specific recombinase XerC
VWQLAVTLTTGKRTFHTIVGDQRDAERELARLATKRGHAPTTLDALVQVHLAHLRDTGRSPSTLRRYEQLWRTWLAPSLGAIAPDELHRADVEHVLTAMHNAGQSDRSIHQAAVVLNTTLAWARENQPTRTNPVVGICLLNGAVVTATRHR